MLVQPINKHLSASDPSHPKHYITGCLGLVTTLVALSMLRIPRGKSTIGKRIQEAIQRGSLRWPDL